MSVVEQSMEQLPRGPGRGDRIGERLIKKGWQTT
jgi:hypothetical protein